MFKKQYKGDFDSILPDFNFVDNLVQGFRNGSSQNHSKKQGRLVAAVLAICFLVGGGFIASNLNKPIFTIIAFANDNGGECVNIEESARVELPFGKISRGERHSYVDETGKTIYNYDVGFEYGGISVTGDNIFSVTYASETGELRFFDSVMEKQMNDEGKIKVCDFTLPVEVIHPGKDMHAVFENLWNDGYFDHIKNKYFKDKNCDIKDYQVMFSQDEKHKKDGLWLVEISHKFENGYPFMQQGKEVTATFYEELGAKSFDVNWTPWDAINMVSEDGPIDFANLPSENITVKVHFKNGNTMTKQLKLSFNSNGNLIAEVITR
ncbi:MAG: hypothetical protein PHQ49_05765 [Clostridia bacterium]|mgnify:CR=1 FL=1|nr:hypothetical protein [Clostridia bacterium]MDD4798743.1 hypothetical protein [Clostridia bacterium]